MPELPEVHTTATMLNAMVVGLRITDAWSGLDSSLPRFAHTAKSPQYFEYLKTAVCGATITAVTRCAKNVLLELSTGATILIHMKMTGHILVGRYAFSNTDNTWRPVDDGPLADPFNRFIRLTFSLSNGETLALCDVRKFAKVALLPTREDVTREFSKTGIDPFDPACTPHVMRNALMRYPRTPIKTALMDQRLIAGIGNIYSDEVLWIVGIHPLSPVGAIPEDAYTQIHRAVRIVLEQGIDFGGDSTSDYRNPLGVPGDFHYHHRAYRRTGKSCDKHGCTGKIVREVVRGRSAHFCDFHQILYRTPMRP